MRHQIGVSGAVLLALVVQTACRNGIESATSPEAPPVPAATVSAVSTTSDIVEVGLPANELPTVIVKDAKGNPLPKVAVLFSQTKGDGVVAGGVTTTNDAGIARPISWRIGTTAGLNVVTASVGDLPKITFTITGIPGPAAFVIKIGGDNQIGAAGNAVAVAPTVRVIDNFGNGVSGVSTAFSVLLGGGTVSGSSVVTDSLGNAAPERWTLGPAGSQTLNAETNTHLAITFAAVSINAVLPCTRTVGMLDRETVHSQLDQESCTTPDGRYFAVFPVLLTDARTSAHQLTLTSGDFDTELELRDVRMNLVATNNDGKNAGTNSIVTALVPAGAYMVVATSHKPGATGRFDLNYQTVGYDIKGCGEAFVMRGVVTTQRATPADCFRDGEYEDRYKIYLHKGEGVYVDMQDMTYDYFGIDVIDSAGNVLSSGNPSAGYILTVGLVAPDDGFYLIRAWGEDIDTTFNLTIR